jgi:hypothetical protein
MNRCSSCGYIVPGSWTECRKCGAPVTAAPAAVAAPAIAAARRNGLAVLPPPPQATVRPPRAARVDTGFGAPDDALIPGAGAHPGPRGVVPDTMLPRIDPLVAHVPVTASSRFNARTIAIGAIVVAIVAAGVYSVVPRGSKPKEPPTVLAPRSPMAGIPTSLSDVVRIAAESARHTALTTVIEAAGITGVPLTLAQLQSEEPSYQWVGGDEASTTNTVVSITSGTAIDVVAVSGTDRDICAFGRWSPNIGSEYVTMAHVDKCSATNAPTTGWSAQRGGSAQDLPGPDGT